MKKLLAFIVMAALVGFMGWFLGPTLWQDYSVSGEQRAVASEYQITKAECSTKLGFLSFCDIEATHNNSKTELSYLIFDSMNNKSIQMEKTAQTGIVTTNIGMEYLNNRIISFLVFEGLLIALMFGALLAGRETASTR